MSKFRLILKQVFSISLNTDEKSFFILYGKSVMPKADATFHQLNSFVGQGLIKKMPQFCAKFKIYKKIFRSKHMYTIFRIHVLENLFGTTILEITFFVIKKHIRDKKYSGWGAILAQYRYNMLTTVLHIIMTHYFIFHNYYFR